MNKNLFLGVAVLGCLGAASQAQAQETITVDETVVAPVELMSVECKDVYSTPSWRSNWYLQLGAGIRSPFMENQLYDKKADDSRHLTAIYNVGVGRWISPYTGFRFSGYYGAMHWNSGTMASARVANLNVDFMWDMFNSIGGYNPTRVFSMIPYIGLGSSFVYDFKPGDLGNIYYDGHHKRNEWMFPVSAGLQLRFRLCKYMDFFAEGRANVYGDNFDNEAGGRPMDIDISAVGGFTVNFGPREFNHYNPCDYVGYLNNANNQINDLRGALAATSAALAAAQAQLPCPEVVEAAVVEEQPVLLPSVRFKINSAYVSSEEMVNVYNIAQYLKANPTMQVVIAGYADKDTGTADYNMKLSQRRAQAVADILTSDYGIDPARLTVQAAGSNTQLYDTNSWNRIVVFALQP